MSSDAQKSSSKSVYSDRRPRVLVVDDEEDIRELLGDLFAAADVQVTQASDGLNALKAVASQRFDLIVSDIKMPNLNGVEFCQLTRRTLLNSRTRIVVVSGYNDGSSMSLLNALGDIAMRDKPVALEECMAFISAATSRKERHRRVADTSEPPEIKSIKQEILDLFRHHFPAQNPVLTNHSMLLSERLQFESPLATGMIFGKGLIAEVHCSLSRAYIDEFIAAMNPGITEPSLTGQDEITREVTEQAAAAIARALSKAHPGHTFKPGPVWSHHPDPYHPVNPTGADYHSMELVGARGVAFSIDLGILRL